MSAEALRSELRERGPSHSEDEDEDHRPLLSLDGIASGQNDDDDDAKHGKALLFRTNRRRASCRSCLRDLILRWKLLSVYRRVLLSLLVILTVQHVVVGCLDVLFQSYGPKDWNGNYQSKEIEYTVVINTYKRPDMLKEAVQHYASTCGRSMGVAQVVVIWAELDVTPPTPKQLLQGANLRRPSDPQQGAAEIQIVRVAQDSLNARFLPLADRKSDSIFMVDDDVRVDCASLRVGFDAWRANPDFMVGYYPRLAIESSTHGYVYQAWPAVYWRQQANFVLTKAAFLHHRYMEVYSDATRHPTSILDYVDKYKNCEDVAMSLLMANATRTTGPKVLYVEGHVSDKGLFGGISSSGKGEHFDRRSDCLRDMTNIYQEHGWSSPLVDRQALADVSWIRHVPGLWWQYRPSNFFEWFAFTNVFKS